MAIDEKGAEERARHPEGRPFNLWFGRLIQADLESGCVGRDVLRACKEMLWAHWKAVALREGMRDGD